MVSDTREEHPFVSESGFARRPYQGRVSTLPANQAEWIAKSNDRVQIALFLFDASNGRTANGVRGCVDCDLPMTVFFCGSFGTIYRCAECHAVTMEPA
jgi:hypothetical protein